MRGWVPLVLSAVLQVGWLESLHRTEGFRRLVPLVWYVLFGTSSTYALSRALESIPVSTAYAVWTALSVVGSVALEIWMTRSPLSALRAACILAILAGTAGLRLAETPQ